MVHESQTKTYARLHEASPSEYMPVFLPARAGNNQQGRCQRTANNQFSYAKPISSICVLDIVAAMRFGHVRVARYMQLLLEQFNVRGACALGSLIGWLAG